MNFPEDLQAARLSLAKERPYLASAAWALQPVSKPGLGTMAVDMYWRLYYDPETLTRWSVKETEGILYHEICHLLRNHADRMKELDPKLSNLAADAEINDDLLREGVVFPTQPRTPGSIGQPEDLLAEEYYAALQNQQECSEEQRKNSRLGDSETEDRSGTEEKLGSANQKSHCDDTPMPGSGRCGSCATGQIEPWEDEPPKLGTSSGVGKMEAELIRRDAAAKINEHSRGQGRVPAHLARWAEEKLNPQVDWRKQLSAAVRNAAADTVGAMDYSYRRPSRRQGQIGDGHVIFPSMRKPTPSVAVVADTSASISEKQLSQTLAEISGILKALGQQEGVHVFAVDHTVAFCRRVFRAEQIQFAGGGGTDMGAGLEAAARLKPLPQVGIVITDGQTPWPDRPPQGMKIIVVLSGDGKAPDWAKVIKIG